MAMNPFRQLLRLIFVLFSLFLMGDAFYRWDGFSYYASFLDFVPAVALVFVQWSLISIILSGILWSVIKLLRILCSLFGFRVTFDQLIQYLGVFVLLSAAVWTGKKLLLPMLLTSVPVKIIVLTGTAFLSAVAVKTLGGRFDRMLQTVYERITPLVWLFGLLAVLSIPVVYYHAWFKVTEFGSSETTFENASLSGQGRPNVILVTFDALTARDMSLYGYQRETTPFITEWARNASLFNRVKAESTFTSPTTASLMAGKRLWSHLTWYQAGSIRKNKTENIAHELKKHGYHTAAYIENSNASPVSLGISRDFSKIVFMPEERGYMDAYYRAISLLFHGKIKLYDWIILDDFYPSILFQKYIYDPIIMPLYSIMFPEKQNAFIKPDTALDKFISDMDEEALPEPFFAWIHLYPPHSPYVAPGPLQGVFDPSNDLRKVPEQHETIYRIKKALRNSGLTGSDLRDMETLRARYNELILFCDIEFKDFIENLETRNMLNDSLVVFSSDHGEIFEHDSLMHGETPYEPVIHIPLIIKEPGQKNGAVINDVVEQVDITATIIDLSGVHLPAWLEGRSLTPLLRGDSLSPRPAFSMHLQRSRNLKITHGFISVYEGQYKLIYFIDKDKALLFDLKHDPGETNDLFAVEHEIGKRLLGSVLENIEKANKRIENGNYAKQK